MDFLFRKVNIASLAFFRIVFGILGFADVLGSWIAKHFIDKALDPERFQFKYYGFEWVKTLPDPFLSMVFILTMIAGLGIAFGKWYRISATIFALGFSYIFFLEKAYYLNHGYLTMVMAWWVVFMPLNRNYSMDVLKQPEIKKTMVDYWSLFLLQFMMGVVYFYGGIAKINPDWLNGQPMKIWLKAKADMPILGSIYAQEWIAYAMSYSGLLLDLLVVFFLINKRTRIFALFFVLFFHLNNFILFLIGIFPFLSIALTLLYFEPEFPIKVWNWLEKRIGVLERVGRWWRRLFVEGVRGQGVEVRGEELGIRDQELGVRGQRSGVRGQELGVRDQGAGVRSQERSGREWLLTCAIVVFGLVMVTIPFRHHLFKGNVAWTEEGHRYSWRMMLRQKRAYGNFTVKNLATNKTERIRLNDYLTKRQKRKMLTHPEMILQFAHFLEDQFEEEYGNEVAVYADIRSKLNDRKYQKYIDSEVDLTQVSFEFFKHAEWIMPLEDRPDDPILKNKANKK